MADPQLYSPQAGALLLKMARYALGQAVQPNVALSAGELLASFGALPPILSEQRACFVTLLGRGDGRLRGCTGTLLPRQALAAEVIYSTVNTALHDPRFEPVRMAEVGNLQIEISILSTPQMLYYDDAADLLKQLRPYTDGVTLSLGDARGTFLPQVWERYPNPHDFLAALCHKMNFPPDAWQTEGFAVEVYQAQKFIE